MAGDRDGNPFVTADVTRDAVLLSRFTAATLYFKARRSPQRCDSPALTHGGARACSCVAAWAVVGAFGAPLSVETKRLSDPSHPSLSQEIEALMFELSMWRANDKLKAYAVRHAPPYYYAHPPQLALLSCMFLECPLSTHQRAERSGRACPCSSCP